MGVFVKKIEMAFSGRIFLIFTQFYYKRFSKCFLILSIFRYVFPYLIVAASFMDKLRNEVYFSYHIRKLSGLEGTL